MNSTLCTQIKKKFQRQVPAVATFSYEVSAVTACLPISRCHARFRRCRDMVFVSFSAAVYTLRNSCILCEL
jgi:hypothetical protein